MARTRSGSRPRAHAITYRAPAGRCDDTHDVQRPSAPHTAAPARGSIGPACSRGCRTDSVTTTSHAANGSAANGGVAHSNDTFVPAASCRSTVPASESARSSTAGRGA